MKSILDFLFPRTSLTGEPDELITDAELRALRTFPIVIEKPVLRSRGVVALDRVVAAADYRRSPLLRNAIHTFKYRRIRAIGVRLPELLLQVEPLLAECDAVCAVPLHWTRKFWRGFNQADLLAAPIAHRRSLPLLQSLIRIRPTGHQAKRGRAERLTALQNAFTVKGIVPRSVVLVDDVFTTGATLDACAKILKQSGCLSVQALVLAVD